MLKKEPIFYIYLQSKIYEKSINGIIKIKEAIDYLHEWRIPKEIRISVIKEMEKMNMFLRMDKQLIRMKKPQLDFSNVSCIYEYCGLLSFD